MPSARLLRPPPLASSPTADGAVEAATPGEIRVAKVEWDISVRGPPLGRSERPSEPPEQREETGTPFDSISWKASVGHCLLKEGFGFCV